MVKIKVTTNRGTRREVLMNFYRATVESVLTFSISVWYGGATQTDKKRLERVVKTASKIIGSDLPSLESIFEKRLQARAGKIVRDAAHPAHSLFELLPSGRRYRTIKTRTQRFKKSFIPLAVEVAPIPAAAVDT